MAARRLTFRNMTNHRKIAAVAGARERRPAGNAALIAAELSTVRCRWCNDDLEHCHETLVRHAIGDVHCMSPDCTTPPELHHMVADCGEIGCGCSDGAASSGAIGTGAA
jgi:hypothetical protein